MNRLTLVLFVVVVAGQGAGSAAAPEEQITLYPRAKPPYSGLFQVPEPRREVKPPQPFIVVSQPGSFVTTVVPTPEPRSFTSRIVCGTKVFEGNADVDPGIVKPIPKGHNAKIRVLGPAPCERAAPATPDRK